MSAQARGVYHLTALVAVVFFVLACVQVRHGEAATVTVAQTAGGVISPKGTANVVTIADRINKRFTITPAAHYTVTDIVVDGSSVFGTDSVKWTGRTASYVFSSISGAHTITATYTIDKVTLTVATAGDGDGTVTADGIDCGGDCTAAYDYGTTVTLTVNPAEDAIFKKWTGAGTQKTSDTTYNLKMNGNRSITATFLKTYIATVTMDGTGTGTVSAPGLSCSEGSCTGTYLTGKKVTLRAVPDSNSKLAAWSGDAEGVGTTLGVTVDADKSITATFNLKAQADKIAEKVSVVDTKASEGVPSLHIGRPHLSAADFPPDSDFNRDTTTVYVNERSAEAFKIVNEILCMIGQTEYDAMLNKGNYKAQIDKNLCSSSKDDPSSAAQASQNQSSGSTMPNYEMWTVNSSRVDDSSPQILKAWIHQTPDEGSKDPPRAIFAKVVITEGVSETNPYGVFSLTFKMFPEVNGTVMNTLMGKGLLRTEMDPDSGKVLLKFAQHMGFTMGGKEGQVAFDQLQQATLDRSIDGAAGGGSVYQSETHGEDTSTESFDFAFNDTNFLRVDGESKQVCTDRTQFDQTAWNYGLYGEDGARVNRNSAFPVKVVKNGKNYYGSIGYYGMWFPSEVTVHNGDMVYKMEKGPGNGTGDPYNLLIAGGKLKKHVRKEMTLGDIKNVPLDYWDNAEQTSYRVKWYDGGFWKVEKMDQSEGKPIWKKLDAPVLYDISSLNFDMLNFWSQSLGGNIQIKLDCIVTPQEKDGPPGPPVFSCGASDGLTVAFYAESVVFPTDPIPATFTCFTNCPNAEKINGQDPFPYDDYGQPQNNLPADAQQATFTFDASVSGMVLESSGTPVLATSEAYQSGVMSGPLFEATEENLALLICDWNESVTCGYQAWNKLPLFYTWETGPNNWNQFTTLVKDSEALKFDPPLQVSYLHTWDDLSTSTFTLEYSGLGNLWGIPGKCISPDSGEEVECGNNTRWIPQFSIEGGEETTDLVDGVTKYYVKPLEMEQRMKQVDVSACSGLEITSYTLPSIKEWTDPNIGAEPAVPGAPAVIGGVLQ